MKAVLYTIFTSFLLSLMPACAGDTAPEEAPKALDDSLKNSKLPREYGDKLRAVQQNPSDHNRNGLYLNQVAEYYLSVGQKAKAAELLKKGIIQHDKSNSTSKNLLSLVSVLKGDASKKQDYINFVQSLGVGYPSLEGLSAYTADIPKGEPSMTDKIASIQSNLTDKTTGRLDLKKVNEFVNIIEYFVMANPTNEQSPAYLKLAAEVVNSVKVYPRAIQFYDWILSKFPNSQQAAQALFMKGFTLDDGMRNKQAAKPIYEEFLKKYPDNDFADDTQFLLDNINKTDEEIIKQFDNKK